jgi:hypothetical protein
MKMNYLKVIGLSVFSIILFVIPNENYFSKQTISNVAQDKPKGLRLKYYQIIYDGDTIANEEHEQYEIFFRYASGVFKTDSIKDGTKTFRFSEFIRKKESLNFKLNNLEEVNISYLLNNQTVYPIDADSNLILPKYSIYKGSFFIRDKKFKKYKVHKFLNFQKFRNNYYFMRSYSFILDHYIPLCIHYPDGNFFLEIESKGLIAELLESLKNSKEYMITQRPVVPIPN